MQFLPAAYDALRSYPQFIIYKIVESKARLGKKDKIPLDYRTGLNGNAHDPAVWLSADDAINLLPTFGEGFGVGFVFTAEDPFFFIDIDDCVENGAWSKTALSILEAFPGAAVEVSQSQKGLHIIASGKATAHTCKNAEHQLEFYTEGRFVALTGLSAQGDAGTNHTAMLQWIVSQYFHTSETTPREFAWTSEPCSEWIGPTDDAKLLERALHSKSLASTFGDKASFRDLWERNVEVLAQSFPHPGREFNESNADLALAQHLAFWTGNDCERIHRLMLQSAMVREKWNREDYLRGFTIPRACSRQKTFYQERAMQAKETLVNPNNLGVTAPVVGTTFLDFESQKMLFHGCVYVADEHRVLIPGGQLLKPEQFKTMFGGYSFPMDVANEKVSRNSWEAFTESQALRHPKAMGTCFRPDLKPAEMVKSERGLLANVYWPIETPRKVGDATPFLNHLKKNFPNPTDQLILLSYLAAIIQYRGIKFQWCPLLQGAEGNGKTLYTRCVAYAIGARYSHLPTASELTEKYNDWMYGTLFVGVEDIYSSDSAREVMEKLKPMITSDRLEIRGMYQSKVMRDICCNFILNSNHKDGVLKTKNDRRFAPFYSAQQSAEDLKRDGMTPKYFTELYGWLDHKDGYAIVNEFLHTFQIPDEFNPALKQIVPRTSSTEDAITQGMGNVEQEILESIDQGVPGFKNGWISSMQLDRLLEKLKLQRAIPHNRRRELLKVLGYDWHPALINGRVNNIVLPDGGKPRLFVQKQHHSINLKTAAEVSNAYVADQTLS